jgi:hypothetical protein
MSALCLGKAGTATTLEFVRAAQGVGLASLAHDNRKGGRARVMARPMGVAKRLLV